MYLTKLLLDPLNGMARRDLAQSYEMHRTLSRVFAASSTALPSPFLWRLETFTTNDTAATVLVQSEHKGNWALLQSLEGYLCGIHPDKEIRLDRFLDKDKLYRFRLLANPTVTREGRRYPLAREEAQLAWLERQAEKAGLILHDAARTLNEKRITHKPGNVITLRVARFDGVLHIGETEKAAAAIKSGIGHAKSMGLGLLSLAPIRE